MKKIILLVAALALPGCVTLDPAAQADADRINASHACVSAGYGAESGRYDECVDNTVIIWQQQRAQAQQQGLAAAMAIGGRNHGARLVLAP